MRNETQIAYFFEPSLITSDPYENAALRGGVFVCAGSECYCGLIGLVTGSMPTGGCARFGFRVPGRRAAASRSRFLVSLSISAKTFARIAPSLSIARANGGATAGESFFFRVAVPAAAIRPRMETFCFDGNWIFLSPNIRMMVSVR